MNLNEVFDRAELVTPQAAMDFLGKSRGTVYNWLRDEHLVARQYGRSWMIPMLRDDKGRPVFLFRGEDVSDKWPS